MFLKPIAVLVLPIVVFLCGAWVMLEMSNRDYTKERLYETAAPQDRKPLNQRLGYDVGAVARHWGALDDEALVFERRFLMLDLVFPFFYGAALMTSMLMAWTAIGRPSKPIWPTAPVAITLVADWTENIVQLGELKRFTDGGEAALQAGWIQFASMTTIIKLLFFSGASFILLALVIAMAIRAHKPALPSDA